MDDTVRASRATKSLQLLGHWGRRSAPLGRFGREKHNLYVPGYFTRQRKPRARQTQPAGGESTEHAARSGDGALRDGRGHPAGIRSRPSCPVSNTGRAEVPRRCRPCCAAAVPGQRDALTPKRRPRPPHHRHRNGLRVQPPTAIAAAAALPASPAPTRQRDAAPHPGNGTGTDPRSVASEAEVKPTGSGRVADVRWFPLGGARWLSCVGASWAVTVRRAGTGTSTSTRTRRSSRWSVCAGRRRDVSESQRNTRRELRFTAPRSCCSL